MKHQKKPERADANGVETLCRLRDAERRAAISRVASTLSHALGTPLNVIAGRAAMIGMGDLSAEEVANNAQIIEQQVRSITNLLQTTLGFAREGWQNPSETNLADVAHQAVSLLAPVAESHGVTLEVGQVTDIQANTESLRALEVVTNLVAEGIRRVERGRRVSVSLERVEATPPPAEKGRALSGDAARFSVHLDGAKLPSQWFEDVYEPWLHPDVEDREAAMLLAVSFGVAREHRGWIQVEHEPELGTTLLLHWPLARG